MGEDSLPSTHIMFSACFGRRSQPSPRAPKPATTIADVPATTIADVPATTIADVPVTIMADVPATTITDVPAMTMADVPVTTIADVPATTIADVPHHLLEDIVRMAATKNDACVADPWKMGDGCLCPETFETFSAVRLVCKEFASVIGVQRPARQIREMAAAGNVKGVRAAVKEFPWELCRDLPRGFVHIVKSIIRILKVQEAGMQTGVMEALSVDDVIKIIRQIRVNPDVCKKIRQIRKDKEHGCLQTTVSTDGLELLLQVFKSYRTRQYWTREDS
jgi:hypothetical protein